MIINTKELLFILENTPAEQNIMLIGKHGIGKSRILEDYYNKSGAKVVTLFLGQMSDPGDLIGLPEKNEKTGKTDFMLPYWFPLDNEPVVLFLDELNRARPEVLQTIMDLTLNRKLAGKSLPEGSRIISAVNNGNEYQLTDLDPALVSRFNIYEFEPSVEDWLEWAKKSELDCRVISFISENPEYLDSKNFEGAAENLERTPDRRSWERVSNIIKKFPELTNLHKPIVTGILGDKATIDFFKYCMKISSISAVEVLTENFEDLESRLNEISFPEFTEINNSIFRFLNTHFINRTQIKMISGNLNKYFNFLGKSSRKEVQAHFISLCSAEIYPVALCFISEHAFDLYKKIIDFVAD